MERHVVIPFLLFCKESFLLVCKKTDVSSIWKRGDIMSYPDDFIIEGGFLSNNAHSCWYHMFQFIRKTIILLAESERAVEWHRCNCQIAEWGLSKFTPTNPVAWWVALVLTWISIFQAILLHFRAEVRIQQITAGHTLVEGLPVDYNFVTDRGRPVRDPKEVRWCRISRKS